MDKEQLSKQTLTFGILGLAFACSFYLGILGIVFSVIGGKKAKAYAEQFGEVTGKAKVGRILAKIGLILGIIATVFLVIYIILVAVGAANGMFN